LLRKAFVNGARVAVIGPKGLLDELNIVLWTFSSTDFLPHCASNDGLGMIQKSPIVLFSSVCSAPLVGDTLINLSEAVPEGFDRYARLIEVVTRDDDDRRKARGRWRRYAEMGISLVRHEAQGAAV
jgi:DNA polymerase-3 subunit chi